MGKYMRKAKTSTGEVAVIDMALGVRTRARTLALQTQARVHASPRSRPSHAAITSVPVHAASMSSSCDVSCGGYLQLRNRRLRKPPFVLRGSRPPKQAMPNPKSNSAESCQSKQEVIQENNIDNSCRIGGRDLDTETSRDENLLNFEDRRSTRESTPCSLMRNQEAIRTPCSTSRASASASAQINKQTNNSCSREVPTALEMDEFFAKAEQESLQYFIEKYNFDFANEEPLPGSYKWVKLNP